MHVYLCFCVSVKLVEVSSGGNLLYSISQQNESGIWRFIIWFEYDSKSYYFSDKWNLHLIRSSGHEEMFAKHVSLPKVKFWHYVYKTSNVGDWQIAINIHLVG